MQSMWFCWFETKKNRNCKADPSTYVHGNTNVNLTKWILKIISNTVFYSNSVSEMKAENNFLTDTMVKKMLESMYMGLCPL